MTIKTIVSLLVAACVGLAVQAKAYVVYQYIFTVDSPSSLSYCYDGGVDLIPGPTLVQPGDSITATWNGMVPCGEFGWVGHLDTYKYTYVGDPGTLVGTTYFVMQPGCESYTEKIYLDALDHGQFTLTSSYCPYQCP